MTRRFRLKRWSLLGIHSVSLFVGRLMSWASEPRRPPLERVGYRRLAGNDMGITRTTDTSLQVSCPSRKSSAWSYACPARSAPLAAVELRNRRLSGCLRIRPPARFSRESLLSSISTDLPAEPLDTLTLYAERRHLGHVRERGGCRLAAIARNCAPQVLCTRELKVQQRSSLTVHSLPGFEVELTPRIPDWHSRFDWLHSANNRLTPCRHTTHSCPIRAPRHNKTSEPHPSTL